jgi:hypothetical protein
MLYFWAHSRLRHTAKAEAFARIPGIASALVCRAGTGLSLQFLDFARQLRCLGKVCGISALSLARANAPRLREYAVGCMLDNMMGTRRRISRECTGRAISRGGNETALTRAAGY